MPLTRHAYPVLQLAKFWFLTYVYVVDPGAELWPDKIVGLRSAANSSNISKRIPDIWYMHACPSACVSEGAPVAQRCLLYGESAIMHASCMHGAMNTCAKVCDL